MLDQRSLRLLWWLSKFVWASTDELAMLIKVHRTTAERRLKYMEERELVRRRCVGRASHPRYRWLLTAEGVWMVHRRAHRHPGVDDGHVHDPQLAIFDHHTHPSYFVGAAGAAEIYAQLELVEAFYPIVIGLFKPEGRWRLPHQLAGRQLKLRDFRWLRGGPLFRAVAEYDEDFAVFISWVSMEMTARLLRWRRDNRHTGLLSHSDGLHVPTDLNAPPDPDFDRSPQPSAHLVVAEDRQSHLLAERVLFRNGYRGTNAVLRVCQSDPALQAYEGEAVHSPDNIWDPFADVKVGKPEELCPPPALVHED